MASHDLAFPEGQGVSRPPLFTGSDFNYWKNRMMCFLMTMDVEVWNMVEVRYSPPTTVVGEATLAKPKDKWDDNDKLKCKNNAKAMNALYCALNRTEFNRISACTTAYDIWNQLEVTHEGTSQVKDAKLFQLESEYEKFRMDTEEDINSMYTRFTKIVNASKALGKTYSDGDLVRKILRSLPPRFNPKVTAISESHNLRTLQIENLIGNLKTHEVELQIQHEEYNKEPKKKALALTSKKECTKEDDDDEEGLLVKNFKKFIRNPERRNTFRKFFQKDTRRKGSSSSSRKEKGSDDEEERPPPECYHCRKTGHIRSQCPKYQKERKEQMKAKEKKKVLKAATWDDSSSEESNGSESSSEEEANLCLMAKSDDDDTSVPSDTEVYPPTFEELYDKIVLLNHENESIMKENRRLTKNLVSLEKRKVSCQECEHSLFKIKELETSLSNALSQNKIIAKEKGDLERKLKTSLLQIQNNKKGFENKCVMIVQENTFLKKQNHDLNIAIKKFGIGQKSLDMILGNQCYGSAKFGVGYKSEPYRPTLSTNAGGSSNVKKSSVLSTSTNDEPLPSLEHDEEEPSNEEEKKSKEDEYVPPSILNFS